VNKTSIEWVKNPDGTQGYTVNSKTGCLNHDNGLCKGGGFPCYAYRLANGRLKERYLANKNWDTRTPKDYDGYPNLDPFYPRWWPEKLEQIRRRRKPAGIFLDDMSDWMGDYWPEGWTRQELQVIQDCPQHRIYTLTKQPQNLPAWSPFPDSCWVGVTCTSRRMINHTLPYLMHIGAPVIYLSLEPFLAWDDFSAPVTADRFLDAQVDWVIIGACTGTKANLWEYNHLVLNDSLKLMPWDGRWTLQPKIEWVREIVEACDKAGIPVFLKNNLKPLLLGHAEDRSLVTHYNHGESEFDGLELFLRQELPK